MISKCLYRTPAGFSDIWMFSEGGLLTGLWFEGSRRFPDAAGGFSEERAEVFEKASEWLDVYFSGRDPGCFAELSLKGVSPFVKEIAGYMLDIPFGETVSYGELARRAAAGRGISRMSAQAVGGAVGRNPISVMIPCHRVVGADGSLTGYGGGMDNKAALLENEGIAVCVRQLLKPPCTERYT